MKTELEGLLIFKDSTTTLPAANRQGIL